MKAKSTKFKNVFLKNTHIAFIIIAFFIICGIVVMTKSKAEENKKPNLPLEYTEVEYIESTGTQYIDTKYVPNANTAVEVQYQITDLGNEEEQSIFAQGTTADATNQYSFSYNNASLYFRVSDCETTNTEYINKEKATLYLDKTNAKYNGTIIASMDSEESLPLDGTSSLYLFAQQKDGTVGNYFVGRMYTCIIKENDTIVRNFVPCYRNSDNVAGLYDTTNGVFYANSGTDDFTYKAIQKPEKIEEEEIATINAEANTSYIMFDISKGNVTIGAEYSGKDASGATVSGKHQPGNTYYITQSDHNTKTTNSVTFNQTSEELYNVVLDNVNMGPDSYTTSNPAAVGEIKIDARKTKNICIQLRNENIVKAIRYYTVSNMTSKLKITSFDGDGSTEGKLYIPEKKEKQEDIDALVNSKNKYNPWEAGIGGNDTYDIVRGITIAGGDIQVLTSEGDNCTAIGGGGNGFGDVTITGGKIKAIVKGTGTAIGGGIGWGTDGGEGNVKITGGEVFGANYGTGVAIGGASANTAKGADRNSLYRRRTSNSKVKWKNSYRRRQ